MPYHIESDGSIGHDEDLRHEKNEQGKVNQMDLLNSRYSNNNQEQSTLKENISIEENSLSINNKLASSVSDMSKSHHPDSSVSEFNILTGKSHQIRHVSSIGMKTRASASSSTNPIRPSSGKQTNSPSRRRSSTPVATRRPSRRQGDTDSSHISQKSGIGRKAEWNPPTISTHSDASHKESPWQRSETSREMRQKRPHRIISHSSNKGQRFSHSSGSTPPISIAADLDLAAREQGEGSNLSSPDTISERNVVHDVKLDGLDGDVGHVSLNEVNGDEEDLGIDFTCSPSHSVNDTRARHMSDDRIERKGVTTKESQQQNKTFVTPASSKKSNTPHSSGQSMRGNHQISQHASEKQQHPHPYYQPTYQHYQHQHEAPSAAYQHDGQGHSSLSQHHYHKQDQRSYMAQRQHQQQQRHHHPHGPPPHSLPHTNSASPTFGNPPTMYYHSNSHSHGSHTGSNIPPTQQQYQPSHASSNSEQYQQYGGPNRRMPNMQQSIQGRPDMWNMNPEQPSPSSHPMHNMQHIPGHMMSHTRGMSTQDTVNDNQVNSSGEHGNGRNCDSNKRKITPSGYPPKKKLRKEVSTDPQESCSQEIHNNDGLLKESYPGIESKLSLQSPKVFMSPKVKTRRQDVKRSPLFPQGSETPGSSYNPNFGVDTPLYNANSFEVGETTPFPMPGMDSRGYTNAPFASPLKPMPSPDYFFGSNIDMTRSMSMEDGNGGVTPSASKNHESRHHQIIPNPNATPVQDSSRDGGTKYNPSPISSSMYKNLYKGLQSSPLPHMNRHQVRNANERNIPMQSPPQMLHPKQHFDGQSSKLFPFDADTPNRNIQIPPLSSGRDSEMNRGDTFRYPRSTSGGRRQDYAGQDRSDPSPGPFRVQIGVIGKMGGMKEHLEDINGVLRRHPRQTLSPDDRQKMQTPIKGGDGRPVATSGYPKSSVPVSGNHFSGMPAPSPNMAKPSPAHSMKEGHSSRVHRRNPCNCKRSKCLKLYCECFAAELYCQGCNCNNCENTVKYESVRSKAINDTKAKNPNAFKPRITVKGSGPSTPGRCASPSKGHNMGCRCKKSACLKKYCECFEAGVICSSKCKCIECLNYVGSQALIDRRRKIKDHRGAEMAMRSADQFWKGGRTGPDSKSAMRNLGMPPHQGVFPSPISQHGMMSHQMGMHPMMSPASQYMGPQMAVRPMGYSPIGAMQPSTPAFSLDGTHRLRRNDIPGRGVHLHQHDMQPRSLSTNTPRTPTARRGFDPHSSKKKMKGKKELAKSYFGQRNPGQTKNTALAIFSFLDNDDIYNASLVSHSWSKLSLAEELWQF